MPIARLLPTAIRLGAVAATAAAAAWTLRRSIRAAAGPGHVDQSTEDALDRLPEGMTLTRSETMGEAAENRQTNVTGRFSRTVTVGGRRVEIDGSALARLRIRRV